MHREKAQGQSTYMAKSGFTMRFDDDVRAVAEAVAEAERRTLTNLIEVALMEYATRRGFRPADILAARKAS